MFGQRRVRDEGYGMGMSATMVGLGIGGILAEGHRRGMANVRAAEEARQQEAYDAAISFSLQNADELALFARELASEVARLTAENEQLRRNLVVRETALSAMRKRLA